MKHKWETRVRRHVSMKSGNVSFYVEKRKWPWGLFPEPFGWYYVSGTYAEDQESAERLAIKVLSNLTKHERDNGAVTWQSHNPEVER